MFACCDDSRDLSAAYVRIALEGVSWAVVSPIVLQLGHFVRLSAWNAKTRSKQRRGTCRIMAVANT